jgi:cyclophilin family peptidyl-prolyl cis-trans isomerase
MFSGKLRAFKVSGWAIVAAVIAGGLPADARAHQYVALDYNLTLNARSRDTVFIEIFDDKPLTQANFMAYVNGGKYDGSFMHRLSRGFVIQGGGFYPEFVEEPAPVNVSLDPTATVDLDGNPATANPTVTNEYSVGTVRSNLVGTIAMARVGGQVNSATNQWFVNYKDNSFLNNVDGGFTVFARVMGDGMALYSAFNSLSILNLNPDVNDNGTRDGGPFFNYSAPPDGQGQPTDGVPVLSGVGGDLLVILEKAKRVDYLGAGLLTNVPPTGLAFTARDAFIDTGTQIVYEGAGGFTVGNGRRLGVREGFNIARWVVNHGTLAPGLQLGSITLDALWQEPSGKLEIQLGGTTVDTRYDRVVVTNGTLLGGTLDVSLVSGFQPGPQESYTILTSGWIVDTFDTISLPQLSAGLVWNYAQTATAITLSVAYADFNRDGKVDTSDYVYWSKFRNTSVSTAYALADANGDKLINDLDYNIWRANLGNTRGGSGSGGGGSTFGVPEPASAALALGGLALLACRRIRRRVSR